MRIQKRTKTKKIILVVLLLAIILIGATLAYFYTRTKQSDGVTKEPTTISKSDEEQAKNLQDNPDDKQKAPNADQPATPTTSSTSTKKQVQMTASTNTSGNTVFIRGGINYPLSDGSCYALLSGPTGQSTRKDTTILQNPGSTDCKTISIPISELAPGKWTFTLHYTSTDYEGVSNEISFTL